MKQFLFALVVAGSSLTPSAHAALVTLSGASSNSLFDVVYDNSAINLFGTPQLSNNVVFFTPTNFLASAQSVGASQSVSSTASFRIVPLAGYDFVSFSLTERGDFQLSGQGSAVNASGILGLTPVLGGSLFTRAFQAITTDGPLPGSALNALGANSPYHELPATSNWQASTTILATELSGLAAAGSVDMTVQNDLWASAGQEVDGFPPFAFIEKKFVGGSALAVVLTPIPEPTSLALLALGATVVAGTARRKKARLAN